MALRNSYNRLDGLDLLCALAEHQAAAVFFDPQYRGVLDKQSYGNEGQSRGKSRAALPQMPAELIASFLHQIERVLRPSGHLFLWLDKFELCSGAADLIKPAGLALVDLITWHKGKIGMGYRTRRSCEYLLVGQKPPVRAKGVWLRRDIPDVWSEKIRQKNHPHSKPVGLQTALIEAVTSRGDLVVDPAAGGYSVFEACKLRNREFLGCDLNACNSHQSRLL